MDKNGGDSGHGAEGNSTDEAAGVVKLLKPLSVKGYDHLHNNSNKGKPHLRGKMDVQVMGDVVSYFHIFYLYSNILLIVKNFSPLSTILLTDEGLSDRASATSIPL